MCLNQDNYTLRIDRVSANNPVSTFKANNYVYVSVYTWTPNNLACFWMCLAMEYKCLALT